jgi:hypothetical protein
MSRYDAALTLAEARERYFEENGFNSSYDDRWVMLRIGGRTLPVFPNTRARVAAARIHDLHHVVAEYDTSWTGEGEIGAWELARGCGPYLAAWVLDLTAFGIGCVLSPRRMLRAFVRGRHSRNLYAAGFDAARLSQRVGDVRRELDLDRPEPRASFADLLSFTVWVVLGLLYGFGGMLSFALFAVAMLRLPRTEQAVGVQRSEGGSAAPV